MASALILAKRLRHQGFTVFIHRPRVRGTDFVDEWFARCRGVQMSAPLSDRVGVRARSAHA